MCDEGKMEFQRARSEEQKDARRQQIIDTIDMLFDEKGYEKITFTQIGKRLDLKNVQLQIVI